MRGWWSATAARYGPIRRTAAACCYGHDTLAGKFYLTTERLLMLRGDLFLFESEFSAEIFRRKIGEPRGLVRVAHNGVSRQEFEPVVASPDATDLVFLGELRHVKGIDVLIEAIAQLRRNGRPVTATSGRLRAGPTTPCRPRSRPSASATSFRSKAPCRGPEALKLGRVMVVPSRFESLPYVVLEAAAGGVPLIATRVGGIPEIYGSQSAALVPPEDAAALTRSHHQDARRRGNVRRLRPPIARAGGCLVFGPGHGRRRARRLRHRARNAAPKWPPLTTFGLRR